MKVPSARRPMMLTVAVALITIGSAARGAPPDQPTTISWFDSGYGMFAAGIGMHTWGEIDPDGFEEADIESQGLGGFQLSGYYVLTPMIHVGGFLYFFKGDHDVEDGYDETEVDVEDLGFGVSAKVGNRVHDRIWLGGALDFGMAYLTWDEGRFEGEGHGLVFFPRFVFDLMALETTTVKVGLHGSLGVQIVPYMAGEAEYPLTNDRDFDLWAVRLVMLIGITVGA